MIIAGFPSHANGSGLTLATTTARVILWNRDNHSCPSRPVTAAHCPYPSVLHLPIFTRRGSVAVDYSNGTETSWYLSAWVDLSNLAPLLTGLWRVGTVGMRKGDRELPRS